VQCSRVLASSFCPFFAVLRPSLFTVDLTSLISIKPNNTKKRSTDFSWEIGASK